MSCLIPLIAGACLLDPTHVTVRAEGHWLLTNRNFYWVADQSDVYSGPLARVSFMAGADLSRSLSVYYGVGHQSFISSHRDSGYEYVVAGFEWHPFRAAR